MSHTRQTITHVPVERLTAHPANIRNDLGDLAEMAASIREHGILQPLTATEHPDDPDRLVLLAGHRRLGGALLAGLTRVPVVIRHDVTDPGEQLVLMLVENCQRRDLHPVEKAEAFGALRNRGMTMSEIARQTGVSTATVSHYLLLLELPEEERHELREGRFTATDAVTMVRQKREQGRKREGGGPRGRPKGRKTTPYFSDAHPLAKTVRAMCGHRGRPKVGTVGCGQCWEQVIRQTPVAESAPEPRDEHEVDQSAVQRVLDGDYGFDLNPAEKAEVSKRWAARGGSLNHLGRLTGWKVDRYFQLQAEGRAAS